MVGGSPGATALAIILLVATLVNAGPINRKWQKRSVGDFNSTDNIFSQGVGGECVTEQGVYHGGESVPSPGPCETCVCRPPTVFCSMVRCPINPGCRTIQRSNQCCPDYRCECEHDGKTYNNGEKIVIPEQPCQVCYCKGGEVMCTSITCYQRDDCQPRYIPGQCCPKYDHCPPLDSSDKKSDTSGGASVKTSRSSNSGYKREMQPWLLTQSASKDHENEHTRAYHPSTTQQDTQTPQDDTQVDKKQPNTVIFTEMTAEEVKTKLKSDADAYENDRNKEESNGKEGGSDGNVGEKDGKDENKEGGIGNEDGNDENKDNSTTKIVEDFVDNTESTTDGYAETYSATNDQKESTTDFSTNNPEIISDKMIIDESTNPVELEDNFILNDVSTLYNIVPQDNTESTLGSKGFTTVESDDMGTTSSPDLMEFMSTGVTDDQGTNQYGEYVRDGDGHSTRGLEDEVSTESPVANETNNAEKSGVVTTEGLPSTVYPSTTTGSTLNTLEPTVGVLPEEKLEKQVEDENLGKQVAETKSSTEETLDREVASFVTEIVDEEGDREEKTKRTLLPEPLDGKYTTAIHPSQVAHYHGEKTKLDDFRLHNEDMDKSRNNDVTETKYGIIKSVFISNKDMDSLTGNMNGNLDMMGTTGISTMDIEQNDEERFSTEKISASDEVDDGKVSVESLEDVETKQGTKENLIKKCDPKKKQPKAIGSASKKNEIGVGDMKVKKAVLEGKGSVGGKEKEEDVMNKEELVDDEKEMNLGNNNSSEKSEDSSSSSSSSSDDSKSKSGSKDDDSSSSSSSSESKDDKSKSEEKKYKESDSSSSSSSESNDSKSKSRLKSDSSDSSSSSSSSESEDKTKSKSKDDSSDSSSSSSSSESEDKSKSKSKNDKSDSSSSSSSSESDDSKSKEKSKSDSSDSSSSSSSSESDDSKSKEKSKSDSSDSSSSSSSSESDDSKTKEKSKSDSSDSSSSSSSSESDDSKTKEKSKSVSSDSSSSSSSSESDDSKSKEISKSHSSSSSESDKSKSKDKSKSDSSDSSSSSSSSESDDSKSKEKSKSDSSSSSDSRESSESKEKSKKSKSDSSEESSESNDPKTKSKSDSSDSSSSSSSSSESDESKEEKSRRKPKSDSSSSSDSNSESKSKSDSNDSSSSSSNSESNDKKSKNKSDSDSSSSSSSSESIGSKSKSDSSDSSSSSSDSDSKSQSKSDSIDSSSSSSSSESHESKKKSDPSSSDSSSSSSESDDSKLNDKSKSDSSDSSSSSSSSQSKSKDKSKSDSSDSSSSSSESTEEKTGGKNHELNSTGNKSKNESSSDSSSSSSSSSESDDKSNEEDASIENSTGSSTIVDSKHDVPHETKSDSVDPDKEKEIVVDGASKKDVNENDHNIELTNKKGKPSNAHVEGRRKHKMTSNLIKEKDDLKHGQDQLNEDDVIVLDITNNNKDGDNLKTGEPTTFHLDLFNLNDDEDDVDDGDSSKTRKGSSKQSQRPMIKVMVQNRKNLNISNSHIILTPADLKILAEYLINEKIKPANQNHDYDDKESSKTNSFITKSLINNGDITMVLNITTMSDLGVGKDFTTEVSTVTEGFDQNEVETFKPTDLMKDDKKSDRLVEKGGDEVDCGEDTSTASSTVKFVSGDHRNSALGEDNNGKMGVTSTEEPCDEETNTQTEVGTTDLIPESTEYPDVHTTLSDDQILKGLIDLMRKTTELKDEESTTIYTHNMRTNNDETSTETVESTTKRKPDGAKNENNDESSSRKVKITDNEAGKESYTATLDDKDLHLLRDFMKKHMNIK